MPHGIGVATPAELNLLRPWREPVTSRRLLTDGLGSVLFHAAVLGLFLSLPDVETTRNAPIVTTDLHKVVHLYAPRYFEPTQKEVNKGQISRELDVRSSQAAPQPQAPRFRAPQPRPGPVERAPLPAPITAPPKIEPPKIEASASPPPPPPPPVISTQPVQPQQPPPPQPEKPKLAFESVGAGPAHVVAPNPNAVVPSTKASVEDVLRNSPANPIQGGGGTVVGDIGDSSTTIPNLNQAPSPGRIGSNLQLLSDPKGVDFKPYLIQVLTAVRRNWLAILPESARLGRRGRVLVQFAIDRTGGVPKLVIAEGAGTDALDRAAVAAISASYPFPPLPTDYKGDQIRLQFAFSYNMPNR
jgi:TonB family protein